MYYKIFISFITFILLSIQAYASNINENDITSDNNDILRVYALIEDNKGNALNHMKIILKNNNGIICEGVSRQLFENSKLFNGSIFSVSKSGVVDINCSKKDIIQNGLIRSDITLELISDGFYSVNNNVLKYNVSKIELTSGILSISRFNNTNFIIDISNINNTLFNTKDSDYMNNVIKKNNQNEKNENLKKEDIIEGTLFIKDFKQSDKINNIEILYNGQKYNYIDEKGLKLILRKNIIDIIQINGIIYRNILLDDKNIATFQYSDIVKNGNKDITIKFDVINLIGDLNIELDGNKYLYGTGFTLKLNSVQIENGFNLKLGDKFYFNQKFDKDTIYKYDGNKKEEFLTENKNFYGLKLNKNYIDGAGRIAGNLIFENGEIKYTVFEKEKLLIEGDNIVIKEFIQKSDTIPTFFIINNEKLNINELIIK